ncbi:MAG: hypothetical protein EBW61_05335 [Rhodobacteraceae bacterium]|nr:hypothetical protein [Paracoccaceae bacterium]
MSADPIVAYCCHCIDCQAKSSSAFGISVWFSTSQFKIKQGQLAQYTFTLDSGDESFALSVPIAVHASITRVPMRVIF